MTSPALTCRRTPPPHRRPLQLVRTRHHRAFDLAATQQIGLAALDDHYVGLGLMHLHPAIRFTMRDRQNMITEVVLVRDALRRHTLGPDEDATIL